MDRKLADLSPSDIGLLADIVEEELNPAIDDGAMLRRQPGLVSRLERILKVLRASE